jgi:hypothetical protein
VLWKGLVPEKGSEGVGALVQRELARWAVRARAGDQRVRGAAGQPVGAATGRRWRRRGRGVNDARRPWAVTLARLETDLMGKVMALATGRPLHALRT